MQDDSKITNLSSKIRISDFNFIRKLGSGTFGTVNLYEYEGKSISLN